MFHSTACDPFWGFCFYKVRLIISTEPEFTVCVLAVHLSSRPEEVAGRWCGVEGSQSSSNEKIAQLDSPFLPMVLQPGLCNI